jgi:branched-chain amino acid transport system permease protein
MLAGVSGTLLGMKYSVYPSLGSSMVVKGFIASTIGGLGSLSGAIIAAILLGVAEMFLNYSLGSTITPVILFGIMLLFLFIRPQGISGKFAQDKV